MGLLRYLYNFYVCWSIYFLNNLRFFENYYFCFVSLFNLILRFVLKFFQCYSLVLQGHLEDVRTLLSQHPGSDGDAFISMDELLRKMPVFQVCLNLYNIRKNEEYDNTY